MNLLQRLEHWGDRHHPAWMDIVRIGLGIFLVYKGIDFLSHMSDLVGMMSASSLSFGDFSYVLAGHYAAGAHILGGIGLALGVYVRIACLIQIPVLVGALLFLNTNKDLLQPYSEIILTLVVLLLLIYFLVAGNGPWSVKIGEETKEDREASRFHKH